jgi:hypothetical protein
MRPFSVPDKYAENRLFPALGKFGDSKKWQFWGGARSPSLKNTSGLVINDK